MRRSLTIFLALIVLFVIIAVHQVFTLITLLFEDASADAIPHAELPAPNSSLVDNPKLPPMIPKIIHQTYINASIPPQWKEAQQSCLDLHQGWEYKVCGSCYSKSSKFEIWSNGLIETAVAVDRRALSRLHCDRVPLVLGHVCRLHQPNPARRLH